MNSQLSAYKIEVIDLDEQTNKDKVQKQLAKLMCVGFFPLMYVIGKTIVTWVGN